MADVSANSQSTAVFENNGAGMSINTITVAAGTDRGLVLIVGCASGNSISAVRWDENGTPQAMSQISATTDAGGRGIQIWALRNPTVGNLFCQVDTTGSGAFGFLRCFNNVKQDGAITDAFLAATPTSGNGTSASITIATATDRYTVEGVTCAGAPSGSSKTQLFSLSGLGSYDGGGSEAAGGTSNAHSWTVPSGNWAQVGVSVVSTNTGGGPSPGSDTSAVVMSEASTNLIRVNIIEETS